MNSLLICLESGCLGNVVKASWRRWSLRTAVKPGPTDLKAEAGQEHVLCFLTLCPGIRFSSLGLFLPQAENTYIVLMFILYRINTMSY